MRMDFTLFVNHQRNKRSDMKIEIDGVKYKVTEKLGFSHDVGHYCYFVERDGKEAMVIKLSKDRYKFWTVKNRLGIN